MADSEGNSSEVESRPKRQPVKSRKLDDGCDQSVHKTTYESGSVKHHTNEENQYDKVECTFAQPSLKDFRTKSKKGTATREDTPRSLKQKISDSFLGTAFRKMKWSSSSVPLAGVADKSTAETMFGSEREEIRKPTPMRGYVRQINNDDASSGQLIGFDHVKHTNVGDATESKPFNWDMNVPLQTTPIRGFVRRVNFEEQATSAGEGDSCESIKITNSGFAFKSLLKPTPIRGFVRHVKMDEPASAEPSAEFVDSETATYELLEEEPAPLISESVTDADQSVIFVEPSSEDKIPGITIDSTTEDEDSDDSMYKTPVGPRIIIANRADHTNPPMKFNVKHQSFEQNAKSKYPLFKVMQDITTTSSFSPPQFSNRTPDWDQHVTVKRSKSSKTFHWSDSFLGKNDSGDPLQTTPIRGFVRRVNFEEQATSAGEGDSCESIKITNSGFAIKSLLKPTPIRGFVRHVKIDEPASAEPSAEFVDSETATYELLEEEPAPLISESVTDADQSVIFVEPSSKDEIPVITIDSTTEDEDSDDPMFKTPVGPRIIIANRVDRTNPPMKFNVIHYTPSAKSKYPLFKVMEDIASSSSFSPQQFSDRTPDWDQHVTVKRSKTFHWSDSVNFEEKATSPEQVVETKHVKHTNVGVATESKPFNWDMNVPLQTTPIRGFVRRVNFEEEATSAEQVVDTKHVKHINVGDATESKPFNWDMNVPLQTTPIRGFVRRVNFEEQATSAGEGDSCESIKITNSGFAIKNLLKLTPIRGFVRHVKIDEPASAEPSAEFVDSETATYELLEVEPAPLISESVTDADQSVIFVEPSSEDKIPGITIDSSTEDEDSDDSMYKTPVGPRIIIANRADRTNPPMKFNVIHQSFEQSAKSRYPLFKVMQDITSTSSFSPQQFSDRTPDWDQHVTVKRSKTFHWSDSSLDKDDSGNDELRTSYQEKDLFRDFVNPSLDAEVSESDVVPETSLDVVEPCNLTYTVEYNSEEKVADESDSSQKSDVVEPCNLTYTVEYNSEEKNLEETLSSVDNNVGSLDATRGSPTGSLVEEGQREQTDQFIIDDPTTESKDKQNEEMDCDECDSTICSLTLGMSSLSTQDESGADAESVFAYIQSCFLTGQMSYSNYRQMLLEYKNFLVKYGQVLETSNALVLPEKPDSTTQGLDMTELMSYDYGLFMKFFKTYQGVMFENRPVKTDTRKKYVYNKTYADWYSEKLQSISKEKAIEKARKEEEARIKLEKEKCALEDTARSYAAWIKKKNIERTEKRKKENERSEKEHTVNQASKQSKAKAAEAWRQAKR